MTRLMIENIRGGGAASSVLARQTQTELVLIDVGWWARKSRRTADRAD